MLFGVGKLAPAVLDEGEVGVRSHSLQGWHPRHVVAGNRAGHLLEADEGEGVSAALPDRGVLDVEVQLLELHLDPLPGVVGLHHPLTEGWLVRVSLPERLKINCTASL